MSTHQIPFSSGPGVTPPSPVTPCPGQHGASLRPNHSAPVAPSHGHVRSPSRGVTRSHAAPRLAEACRDSHTLWAVMHVMARRNATLTRQLCHRFKKKEKIIAPR